MWNSQVLPTHPGPRHYLQNPQEPNSWEDLLENDRLEQQLAKLNFGQYGQGAPINARPAPPRVPIMEPPPLQYMSRHPPPLIRSIRPVPPPPAGRYPSQFPHNQNGYARPRQTHSNGIGRPPLIDTSVPPPPLPAYQTRPVLLQRPVQPQQHQPQHQPSQQTQPQKVILATKGPLTNTDTTPPFQTSPVVKIVGEDEHRTQYTAPGPKVKILKRPSSTPSDLSSQGQNGDTSSVTKSGSTSKSLKSLKEREEEYAKARLRILGSTGIEEAGATVTPVSATATPTPVSATATNGGKN